MIPLSGNISSRTEIKLANYTKIKSIDNTDIKTQLFFIMGSISDVTNQIYHTVYCMGLVHAFGHLWATNLWVTDNCINLDYYNAWLLGLSAIISCSQH